MNILVAPDSFKGSLTAQQAAAAIKEGIQAIIPDARIFTLPMADGGEGTVDVLVDNLGGTIQHVVVQGPLGDPVTARYGILSDQTTGVMEMASASGLTLIPEVKRNPLLTSTYGTGELIRRILDEGCRRIIVGIGGSATNDGGTGMATALGIQFLDAYGKKVPEGGGNLHKIATICSVHRDPRLDDTEILVACDVNNPLLGKQGASHVYGPQKGATPQMVAELEKNLAHLHEVFIGSLNKNVAAEPGAGAAGGLGAGLMVFAGGRFVSGVELIMDMVQFDKVLDQCQIVCTGEGRLDLQTLSGKVIAGIVKKARKKDIPVIIFAGELSGDNDLSLERQVIPFSIAEGPTTRERMMKDAYDLLTRTAQRVFKTLSIGERG